MEFSERPIYGAFEETCLRNLIKEMFKEIIKGIKGDSREGEYYLIGNIVVDYGRRQIDSKIPSKFSTTVFAAYNLAVSIT